MGKDLKGRDLGVGLRQRPNGQYTGRYVDRFGNRREIYSMSLTEVKVKLAQAIEEDSKKRELVVDQLTLSEWYDKWLHIHKYKVIRENSKVGYDHVFRKNIEPYLGEMFLTQIKTLDVKRLINILIDQGYKYATLNRVRILLLDMFDKAIIDDLALKNPAKGIKINRDESKDLRVLSKSEQAEFFDCCKGTFYDNLFVVAVNTGLRQGEICALTWDDIDFKQKMISVTKTLVYQQFTGERKKNFHIDPPKTKSSYRKVPINRQCEMALKKQFVLRNNVLSRKYAKPIEGYENLLFVTKYGTPINATTYNDAINRIIDEINLTRGEYDPFEKFSSHCFRHTFATRCFEAKVPPKTVQQLLGHASISMTMDLYTHVFDGEKHEATDLLGAAFDEIEANEEKRIEEEYRRNISTQVVNFMDY